MFTFFGNMKCYGPVELPSEGCLLTDSQGETIKQASGLLARFDEGKEWGIWQTMQACFGHKTRSIPPERLIPSSRRDPFSQRGVSRLTRYNPSRRLLSRRMKWRSIGTHDPTTIDIHSRKCPLTRTRPGTGAYVPPGSPLPPPLGHARDPEPTPAHPEVRRASMHETRGEGTVRR